MHEPFFGLPAYLILLHKKIVHVWAAIALGFGTGVIMWLVVMAGFADAKDFHTGWEGALKGLGAAVMSPSFIVPGLIGSLVGFTIWWILRPILPRDRKTRDGSGQ
jgi:hypothetical protein